MSLPFCCFRKILKVLQELRSGKYIKQHSKQREVLATALELGLPVESAAGNGITLLPATTVEELLANRRRHDLVQPFKLGLLKLASQETARLLASGQYELALPVAQDAVKQGMLPTFSFAVLRPCFDDWGVYLRQKLMNVKCNHAGEALFKPLPAIQMFPLYLLAAQANLGLRRGKPCEDLLGMACWLSSKMPEQTTNVMASQLQRLYGQLYALQGRHQKALEAFAVDVYCCSQEYGPLDARTSLGFYNLGKVFQACGEAEKAVANFAVVVNIWLNVLMQCVLAMPPADPAAQLAKDENGHPHVPLGTLQLVEVSSRIFECHSLCMLQSYVAIVRCFSVLGN
jgi:tetratricopeptide (TPR) repeat protein